MHEIFIGNQEDKKEEYRKEYIVLFCVQCDVWRVWTKEGRGATKCSAVQQQQQQQQGHHALKSGLVCIALHVLRIEAVKVVVTGRSAQPLPGLHRSPTGKTYLRSLFREAKCFLP
ncbi:hypothetical protein E2C01_092283 [Portunus trituberculatus]|uniref:Uncharacterized protein n=1 Tax=Portunus trituberculatus TaxID=210409 RepID=A0A5B7JRL5_PORTR|nr:hypothetical protein [Portunus trituberculatus]